MPRIPFPNVPNVAGVPVIFRSLTVPTPEVAALSALGALTDLLGLSTQWGIYDQRGNKVLDPDTILAIDYQNGARVSNYPQEQGAFAAYNKVQTPYDVRVRMAIGTDRASRTAFLETCETMLQSVSTFVVVTPEVTYLNATLEHYPYRRETRDGTTLITVDLMFVEVRVAPAAQYSPSTPGATPPLSASQVQSPDAASSISNGQVSATTPIRSPVKIETIQ